MSLLARDLEWDEGTSASRASLADNESMFRRLFERSADDYLTKPVANADLVRAIEARLRRTEQQTNREFKPDFSSAKALLAFGLTPRAAEVLLWVAQGKTNSNIATILGITESTVKKHVQEMFDKLGVETRGAATVRAFEVLNSQPPLATH